MKINKEIFSQRLKSLIEENSETVYSIGSLVGLSAATISRYTTGEMAPKIPTIESIARYFKVNPSWLMGLNVERDLPTAKSEFSITPEEQEHIKKYRALDEHGKETVNVIVDRELQRTQVIASLKKQLSEMEAAAEYMPVMPLRVSTQKVAAGHGVYLGPEDFNVIKIQENELTRMANFAVPVAGDSMEPKFHDGDILLVGEELPEIGDIGIFTMDGYGYVKKRGENELISLNTQYPPIPMKDSIISNGKVIGVLDSSWIVE